MIQTGDIHDLSGLDTATGGLDILSGRRHIATRMIVQQQETVGIREDPGLQDVGNRRDGSVDAAHTDDIEIDGLQLVAEVYDAEDLPVILGLRPAENLRSSN